MSIYLKSWGVSVPQINNVDIDNRILILCNVYGRGPIIIPLVQTRCHPDILVRKIVLFFLTPKVI